MTFDPNELSSENMSTQEVAKRISGPRDLTPIELCLIVAVLTMAATFVISGIVT